MPMIWNAQSDAKLLQAIIKVFDVKGAKLQDVARLMGPDCTPKALNHRLTKLRQLANSKSPSPANVADEDLAKASNNTRKETCGATKKGGRLVNRTPSLELDDDEERLVKFAVDGYGTPPGTVKRGMGNAAKRTYAKADDDDDIEELGIVGGGAFKKIKVEVTDEIEVGEDIGEGLRKGC